MPEELIEIYQVRKAEPTRGRIHPPQNRFDPLRVVRGVSRLDGPACEQIIDLAYPRPWDAGRLEHVEQGDSGGWME